MAMDRPLATPLELTSAGDAEAVVRAQGSLFIVTNRHGNVTPAGARELGLFFEDTRYLSHYELTIPNVELLHLSADATGDAYNQFDLMLSGLEETGFLDDPQNYLHIRRRQLLDGRFTEEITLTNFLQREVKLTLALAFAADYADIFEVRGAKRTVRGVHHPPHLDLRGQRVVLGYRGTDGRERATTLTFSVPPRELTDGRALFHVAIDPGRSTVLEIGVEPSWDHTEMRSSSPALASFEQQRERVAARVAKFTRSSARFACDDSVIQHFLEQAIRDLDALTIRLPEHEIVAAGIPWFCCPFGRDSLIASYEALLVTPDLARSTLRTLAAYQGKRFDSFTEEEPGKIFHELRFGEMTSAKEMPHTPYYGSIDATPLFVILADATYKFTADLSLLRELQPAIEAALGFIDARSERGGAFVTYEKLGPTGLDNQGWKDSRAAVCFPDGRRASPPIALCEVQGYCIDAYARGARIFEALGDADKSAAYLARSRHMRELFVERFWMEAEGRFAYALDGKGELLPTVVSNLGHLLWSRVPSHEAAFSTAELLCNRESFSGFGVRTLARGQPAYNPLSYHNGTVWPHDNALIAKGMANYRLTQHAVTVFEGLVRAMGQLGDRRLPELFCGMGQISGHLVRYPVACSPQAWATAAPFLLLQSILGIHPDGPHSRLAIRNAGMPPSIKVLEIEGLRVGDSKVSMRFRRFGKACHVDRLDVSGAPLRTEIEIG
jgi:glycogen debranching enzyme